MKSSEKNLLQNLLERLETLYPHPVFFAELTFDKAPTFNHYWKNVMGYSVSDNGNLYLPTTEWIHEVLIVQDWMYVAAKKKYIYLTLLKMKEDGKLN